MVLYIVGLGLGDEKDITIRGLECVKKCKVLYLEYYTSILGIDHVKLEKFYGVPIVLADRNMVQMTLLSHQVHDMILRPLLKS